MVCLCCVEITFVQARILTVSNMPNNPGQFTNVQDALIYSFPDDTIYVHGSLVNYGDINIGRPIVIIGTGHNPVKQAPLVSALGRILVFSRQCQLIGLTFESLSSGIFTDITIKRCRIISPSYTPAIEVGNSERCVIEGNVFDTPDDNTNVLFGSQTEMIIQNNILDGKIIGSSDPNSLTSFIINNVFLGTGAALDFMSNAIVNNNIFFRASPMLAGSGCSMNNNISYQCANNTFPVIASLSNNLENVDPMFVNVPDGTGFNYSYDYHLTSTSPGFENGTDGTDRGVYGGFGEKFSMTGEPAIAEVTEFKITSPTTIAPGGTLTISVKSRSVR